MKSLLIVDDDATIRGQLAEYLEKQNFRVHQCGTYKEASAQDTARFDLAIVDWNLGDGEGIDLVRLWRDRGSRIPVIMLTARADVIDRVLGLEIGSQDYVTKPYEPRELLARIRVHLRADSVDFAEPKAIEASGVSLDLAARAVRRLAFEGDPEYDVELTKMEFDLLATLLKGAGKVFTREELLNRVWGIDSSAETRTVDAHVARLRQKIFEDLIETVRGLGYRIRKGPRTK